MKRIFVLTLALIVAVSSMAVPSYAVEYPAEEHNLLEGYFFDCYREDTYWTTQEVPSAWIAGYTSAYWEWECTTPVYMDKIVFTLELQKAPSAVYLKNSSGNFVACTLVHAEDNVYQYVYDKVILVNSELAIKIEFSSDYHGRFNITSCVGYSYNYSIIDTVDWFANAVVSEIGWDEWGEPTNFEYTYVHAGSGTNEELPFSVGWNGELPTDNVLYYGEAFLKIPFDTYQFVDNVRIMLMACGDITAIGARLENSSGVVAAGLSYELTYCGETQYIFELAENMERIECYILDVDVGGYDLRDLTLSVSAEIDRVFGSSAIEQGYGFYFGCESVALYLPQYEPNPLAYFASWLKTQFSSVSSWIKTQTSSITSALNSGFQSLLDVFNASGDNDGFNQDVQNQGDKLDDMQDVMDSVTQPALDSIDTDLSGIVGDSDLASVSNVYTMVIGDSFVPQIMTMVVVMAMMSFALFGKR